MDGPKPRPRTRIEPCREDVRFDGASLARACALSQVLPTHRKRFALTLWFFDANEDREDA